MTTATRPMPTPQPAPAPGREAHYARARAALRRLYGGEDDKGFGALMKAVDARLTAASDQRPAELRALDVARVDDPHWYAQPGRVAYCTYIDRFNTTLRGCIDKVAYLKALGVGLFHPLPLLKPREGDNDGGFAVADYRAVDPRLGTFDDLKALAGTLRRNGMSLVLDVVCNHTAREHPWARSMVAGDPDYRDFYIVFQDEAEKDAWAGPLIDVFPDTAPGSFTFDAEAGGWVWTTFYPFQWDLNYANPRVFLAMLDVLLDLANAGVEGFRLDSAAYLWKIKGTVCRNLAQAHDVLVAFRSLLAIACPGVFLLAEAIEGLDEVLGYFGSDAAHSECDMAYNNTMMTALWGSLAEGTGNAARQALRLTGRKPGHGVWLNYVRCHDDIIWQAVASWVSQDRLRTWSRHYAGADGSFADGMAFQAPKGLAPSTCGMAASLCGVGRDRFGLDRLKLLYSVTAALDGVPMVYMGDEIALLNDRSFEREPERAAELRWLHRPAMDWTDVGSKDGMFGHLMRLMEVQKEMAEWRDGGPAVPARSHDARLLVFHRRLGEGWFTCVANFSEAAVDLPESLCGVDRIGGRAVAALAAYQVVWYYGLDAGARS